MKPLELESGAMIITHSEKLWVRGQNIITEIIQFFMRERERETDMNMHAVRIAFCNSAALDNVWINNGIQYEIEL